MSESFNFLTPPGRLVSGSFFDPQKKDHQGKDKPESDWNYYIGLAFPKTTQQWWDEQGELGAVFSALRQAAADHYKGQENQMPAFKWKIDDGDNPKHAGKAGYAGHWILKFNRQYSIDRCPLYDNSHPTPAPIVDPQQAKRGHWYRISGSSKANGAVGDQAGVYVNMNMAQWLAHGEEIVSGPDASQVFGTPVNGLPAGASTTPVAPSGGMPSAPAAAPGQAPGQAAPSAPPAAAPSTPPQPAASPQQPPAPAAAPGQAPKPDFAQGGGFPEKYQYQGGAYTKEQLLAGGHTEEMIATYPKA